MGRRRIAVTYTVKKENQNLEGKLERLFNNTTIHQLNTAATNQLTLPGLVTAWYNGKRITNTQATIEDVMNESGNPGLPFHFTYDKDVNIAVGGFAEGGRAVAAKKGGRAIAEGGRGMGGEINKDGDIFGGDAEGGAGWGDQGEAGRAFAGMGVQGKALKKGATADAGNAAGGEMGTIDAYKKKYGPVGARQRLAAAISG
ncbi:hypothetical protein OQA88_2529 [Cercophora sp. LCS_1]